MSKVPSLIKERIDKIATLVNPRAWKIPMIGPNSITRNLIIPNVNDPQHSFEVIVQANKNHGICDIILPGQPVAPEAPHDTSNGEAVRAYNDAKKLHQAEMASFKARRSYLLNFVQGNQIDSKGTLTYLSNILYYTLNSL